MNPRELDNAALLALVRDAQFQRNLGLALPRVQGPRRAETSSRASRTQAILDSSRLREAEAELFRRAQDGRVASRDLQLAEIDINALAQAVRAQAESNAEASIALEERLNPEVAAARRAGQVALGELATGGASATEQARLVNEALVRAGIVTPTLQPEDVRGVPVGTQRVALPAAPVAPQLTGMPRVDTAQVGRVEIGNAPVLTGMPSVRTERVGPSGPLPVERIGRTELGAPAQAERVQIGSVAEAPRTVQEVSQLQQDVERLAGEDLALRGQLSSEQRAEVVRAALAGAGLAGVTGGTARDITARDLGLSSLALERERRDRAERAGAMTESRNARQAAMDAERVATIAAERNLSNRAQAQLDAARAQFNAGLITQAQLAQFENDARVAAANADAANRASLMRFETDSLAARQNASESNQNARFIAALQDAREQFNAGQITRNQLAQFENDARAAMQNASQTNENARFIAALQDARERFNAGMQSEYAMAAYNSAVQAGMSDAEAANAALRTEAMMLMDARESERGRQFAASESAAERQQSAIRSALSTLQDNDRTRLAAAQIAASAERPLVGLDPSSIADIIIAQNNQRNQLAMQNEAIRRQQQSANLAAAALNSQLGMSRPRLTTNSGANLPPITQTIGSAGQIGSGTARVQQWYQQPQAPRPSALRTATVRMQPATTIAPVNYTQNAMNLIGSYGQRRLTPLAPPRS